MNADNACSYPSDRCPNKYISAIEAADSPDIPGQITTQIIAAGLTTYYHLEHDLNCKAGWGNPIGVSLTGVVIVGDPDEGFIKMYDKDGENYLKGKLSDASSNHTGIITIDTIPDNSHACKRNLGKEVAISGDGTKIAFSCDAENEGDNDMFIGNFDDSLGMFTFVRVIMNRKFTMTFSRDGAHLFIAYRHFGEESRHSSSSLRVALLFKIQYVRFRGHQQKETFMISMLMREPLFQFLHLTIVIE